VARGILFGFYCQIGDCLLLTPPFLSDKIAIEECLLSHFDLKINHYCNFLKSLSVVLKLFPVLRRVNERHRTFEGNSPQTLVTGYLGLNMPKCTIGSKPLEYRFSIEVFI
jgi:hypothetical protein